MTAAALLDRLLEQRDDSITVTPFPGFDHLPVIDRPHVVAEELFTIIRGQIDGHARSAQTVIGPSEIGHPCPRWLLRKLAGVPEVKFGIPWRATVGTALHTWNEEALQAHNRHIEALGGQARWLTENRVMVGLIGGREIWGSCDAYDLLTDGVWDWKTKSKTKLVEIKRKGPDPQNQTQAHLYGRGWELRGKTPRYVANFSMPRDGELRDSHIWAAPYDRDRAIAALARCDQLTEQLRLFGLDLALTLHPLCDGAGYCEWCPRERPTPTTASELFRLPGGTK